MYETYWGLQRSPFSLQAARESLIASPVHAEALARLEFLCESRSPFGLLLGPGGSGKSAVLTEFAERSQRTGCLVGTASAIAADEPTLLAPLAEGLRINAESGTWQLWQRVVDRLDELKLENVSALFLIDDLDRAGAAGFCLVERLLSLADAPLTVVATARQQSALKIGQRLLDQAALRIDLAPWNEDETRDYLNGNLGKAGRLQPAFNADATRRLFELSGGAPRKVNQLAQLALVAGAGQKLVQIDVETIDAVQEELSIGR